MTQNTKSFWISLHSMCKQMSFTNKEIIYMITLCCISFILHIYNKMVLFSIDLVYRLSFQYTKHIALKIRPKIECKVDNNFLPYVLSATWESSPSKYHIAFSREVARDVRRKFLINKCYTSFLSISEMIQDYIVQPYYNKGTIFYAKTSVFLMWFIYIV